MRRIINLMILIFTYLGLSSFSKPVTAEFTTSGSGATSPNYLKVDLLNDYFKIWRHQMISKAKSSNRPLSTCLSIMYANYSTHNQTINFIFNDDDEFNTVPAAAGYVLHPGPMTLSNSTYFELGCSWPVNNAAGYFELWQNGVLYSTFTVNANSAYQDFLYSFLPWQCGDVWAIYWYD